MTCLGFYSARRPLHSKYWRLFAIDSKSGQINAGGKQDSSTKNHSIKFSKVDTSSSRLEDKINFMKWQVGLIISIAIAFVGAVSPLVQKMGDKFISQAINDVLDSRESISADTAEKKLLHKVPLAGHEERCKAASIMVKDGK
ncbi:unnamed protein product [Tuber aestivum]|uniref:Uncharacterized protein n=1 Tax=Tuber aestivum TaxID=59557 RepID=A0A292PNH4_9PEZI|nr:unnamed protein product [Tuber aestivum]